MLHTLASTVLLLSALYGSGSALYLPYVAPPANVSLGEGLTPQNQKIHPLISAQPSGSSIDRTGWTVTCDSYQPGYECNLVLDGDQTTFWHTEFSPTVAALPHTIIVDMKASYPVNGVGYQPRQDGSPNGNIGQHQVFLSSDGVNWGTNLAFGTWLDDSTTKYSAFEPVPARYVKILAITEAGNRGTWTSMAEINVFETATYTAPATGLGQWGPTIDFPIVPVAAAVEPNTGKVLVWSSWSPVTYQNGPGGLTQTALYDPSTLTVTQRVVTQTDHDMFCPGVSVDFNGRVVVTGGNDAYKTSIYDPNADTWTAAAPMQISRGYQSSATCSDGRIFTIGGSWSGGEGGKNGEIYNPTANTWTLLPGCPVAPMLTDDDDTVYRQDNHGWLFGWKSGSVFQAGPSKAMNWYQTSTTNGSQSAAGLRGSDTDAMCGNAVLYDAVAGKIVTLGGSPDYSGAAATPNANLITLPTTVGGTPNVLQFSGMYSPRIFANAVVLPNGWVFVNGGQSFGDPFGDDNSQLTPEMWNPSNLGFYQQLPNSTPRNYHSVSLLLPDATIFTGGSGLCDTCSTNHFDAQIFTPQYLLTSTGAKATRPTISSVSATTAKVGAKLTIKTGGAVTTCSLIRYGSATHTVDTDQRRVPLTLTSAGTNTYTVTLPTDPGVVLPGYWMLFVLNSAGVPSVASTIKVTL